LKNSSSKEGTFHSFWAMFFHYLKVFETFKEGLVKFIGRSQLDWFFVEAVLRKFGGV